MFACDFIPFSEAPYGTRVQFGIQLMCEVPERLIMTIVNFVKTIFYALLTAFTSREALGIRYQLDACWTRTLNAGGSFCFGLLAFFAPFHCYKWCTDLHDWTAEKLAERILPYTTGNKANFDQIYTMASREVIN